MIRALSRFDEIARRCIIPNAMAYFKDCRLARMSSGRYCLIRDLGPVKGGKGLKHHEVVVDFTLRGFVRSLWQSWQKAAISPERMQTAQQSPQSPQHPQP